MKKKGFTLIELLAIITVLAIITLVTIPVVVRIINNASNESSKKSVIGYAKAYEQALSNYQMLNPGKTPNIDELSVNTKGNSVSCLYKLFDEDDNINLSCCTVDNHNNKYYNYISGNVSESNSCQNLEYYGVE